ncbi:MAG: hypothetical protein SGPRY_000269, partial [Prymnesium sp.]
MGADFTAAPACTIDVSSLRASRFLWLRDSLPPSLPYRDEQGRISLTLLRRAAADADSLCPPPEVCATLSKWLRHAEHWFKSTGHAWSTLDSGVWHCPQTGERREEISVKGKQTEEPLAAAPRTSGAGAQRVASRLPPKRPRNDVSGDLRDGADGTSSRKVSTKSGVKQQRYGGKSGASQGKVKLVVKGRAAVDASCPIASDCHVYDDGARVYDALLNQTDIAQNHNKYYMIQLLETDDGSGKYYCWNRWGRVGETKNEWSEAATAFEPVRGKYTLIFRDYGHDKPASPSVNPLATPSSQLDARVASFVELICDVKMMVEMVEALGNIQLAARAIASGDGTSSIHPIDARYRELHTCLQPIDTGSPTHRLLQDYLANTHASTHTSYKLELQQAFSVEREGEEAAFRDVGNRQLLFHGSRLTNWA